MHKIAYTLDYKLNIVQITSENNIYMYLLNHGQLRQSCACAMNTNFQPAKILDIRAERSQNVQIQNVAETIPSYSKTFSLYFLRGQKKSLLYLAHTGAKIFQKMHFRIEVKIIDASIFSYNQIQVISCEPEL